MLVRCSSTIDGLATTDITTLAQDTDCVTCTKVLIPLECSNKVRCIIQFECISYHVDNKLN